MTSQKYTFNGRFYFFFTSKKGLGQMFDLAYFSPVGTLGKGFEHHFAGIIFFVTVDS